VFRAEEDSSAGTGGGCGMFLSSDIRLLCSDGGFAAVRDMVLRKLKRFKGIWWMPWHREATKDAARCDKPRGAASRL
jgi:hypothetical protein